MRNLALLMLWTTPACVRVVANGPDLGPCAVYPDGAYAYGQVGIGTCLAGPADMQFVDGPDGRYLVVINADPFRVFDSGSVLTIPVDSLDLGADVISTASIPSHALPMEHFLGRFALLQGAPGGPAQTSAIIPSRYSPDAYATLEPDKVWLVDLTDPANPTLREDRPFITVRQDPFSVQLFGQLAFVLSPTDDAVSVINMAAQPPELLDPAPASLIRDVSFDDADGSGSTAELITEVPSGAEILTTDVWTASWVAGTDRLWVPQADGLARWNDGGAGPLTASGLGLEIVPDGTVWETTEQALTDPWFGLSTIDLSARLYLPQGDTVRYLASYDPFGVWSYQSGPLLANTGPWAEVVGGPAVLDVAGRRLMFFDGRETADGPASLGVATTADGENFRAFDDPVVTPAAPFTSLVQPAPIVDPFLGMVRVWTSARDGDRWVIALTESGDGLSGWSAPTTVLEVPGESVGAPNVSWWGGAYHMHLAVTATEGGEAVWWFARSTSYDGVTWTPPERVLESDRTFDAADPTSRPPRAAVQLDPRLGWSLTGQSAGDQARMLFEGLPYGLTLAGVTAHVASGFAVGTEVAGPLSATGIEPGSLAVVQGVRTLYATATDADGVPHLLALRELGDRWAVTASDLIPNRVGEDDLGTQSPTVIPADGGYVMLYAAGAVDGSWLMRRATSTDGLVWTPDGDAASAPLLASPPDWMAGEQLPHGAERTATGWRVWFSGSEIGNDRLRIGAIDSVDGVTWTITQDTPILAPGEPGTYDDAAVRDPQPAVCSGQRGIWYSANDGGTWAIGFASIDDDLLATRWVRQLDGAEAPVLAAIAGTFAATGVRSPVLSPDEPADGSCAVLTSGFDGNRWRVGETVSRGASLFPTFRTPSPGDALAFTSVRGEPGTSTIDLGQIIDGFGLPGSGGGFDGSGPSVMAIDGARGLLFISGKTTDTAHPLTGVIVVDVRDDSTTDAPDTNYLDIETFIWLETVTTSVGVQDMVYDEASQRLYLGTKDPGAVWVVDTAAIEDNAIKEITYNLPSGLIPMHDINDDAGETTFAILGPSGLALVPDQGLLLVTHFKDNALSVVDLSLGVWGQEIRYHQDIGENPSIVRTSPDGRYAVVANYLGAVDGNTAGSSLVLLDLDPSSPTWLEITTRIDNR